MIMHKFLYIVLIAFFPLCAHAENGEPLYIVDDYIGASPDLIDPDEVYSTSILDSVTAVDRYGRRGANGAIIIHTQKYARSHNLPIHSNNNKNSRPYSLSEQEFEKKYGSYIFWLVVAFIGLLLLWLLYGISGIILKIVSTIRNQLIFRGSSVYSPGPFDHDGERFYTGRNPQFYARTILLIILFGIYSILRDFFKNARYSSSDNVHYVFIVFIIVVFAYCIAKLFEKPNHYIVIDDQGIRSFNDGDKQEEDSNLDTPNIDIRWDDVTSAKRVRTFQSKSIFRENSIEFFSVENPNAPKSTLNIDGYPSQKIVDCINFFYSNSNKQITSKQQPLVEPLGLESNFWYRSVLAIAMFVSICVIMCSSIGIKLLVKLLLLYRS